MATATSIELVGREHELAKLAEFVDGLTSGTSATVIRGEAGIGKTVLWRAAVDAAERSGVSVLVSRCAEAEMPLALGGLGDLLETALLEVAGELPEFQRRALSVVVGLEAPPEEPPDSSALPRAFLACLRALAARSPVLVAIDDVQWLDAASQRILAFSAKRLGDASVGVLVAQRGTSGDPLDLRHAIEHRVADIDVGPLSVGALHHLIRSRLGIRIPRPTMARVHEASGGNPMFALEFAQVAASAGGPLPVPASLEELVRNRVARLPPETLPLLAAAAVVERPTVSLLGQVVDDAVVLIDTATVANAITVGSDGVVRFAHPLLASAAYAAVPPATREAVHTRLAGASSDPEERARHRALSTFAPDAEAARLLDAAAARAASRGAPDAAADLSRHALRLTPPDDAEGCEERSLAIATYLTDAGQMSNANVILDELLAGPVSGDRRARALLLAYLVESDLESSTRLAEEALQHARDPAVRVQALLYLASIPLERGDVDRCEAFVREALPLAEELGDPLLHATVLMCASEVADFQGRPEPALIERAIQLAGTRPPLKGFITPRHALAKRRWSAGELLEARELLESELAAARSWGNEGLTFLALMTAVDLEWLAGRWDRAERYLEEARQAAFDGGSTYGEALALSRTALLAASAGRVEEARRLAFETVRRGEEFHVQLFVTLGKWVLGFLALSLDEGADAWGAFEDLPEAVRTLRTKGLARARILPDAIEAAVAVDRLAEAEAMLADFETATHGHAWAAHAAARCRGLLLLARGESEAALAVAEKAISGFEEVGFPLDHGRALLLAGEALRRLGERSRAAEKLEAARQVFVQLGASSWAARAEKGFRRASPRPRRDRDLTTAERRVAALVAAGRTNREVAAQLFTTVGTVEVHLTRIYRKLDLRSPTELARQVADGTLDLGDD